MWAFTQVLLVFFLFLFFSTLSVINHVLGDFSPKIQK